MKTGKYIFTLIFLLTSFIFLDAQSGDLNRKLLRAQTNIQRLQKTVNHIQNNEIKILYTEARDLLNQAWQYYHSGNYVKSQQFLSLTNGKLLRILQILKSNPVFNRKYITRLENTLRNAERQVRSSNNQNATYFLDQAYSFKQQGLNLIQSSNGQFINGIELLFMSEKFARRAIELSSGGNTIETGENDFENRFTNLSEQIRIYKRAGNTIPQQKVNELEKALWRAKRLYNRGNLAQSYKILRRVENRINELSAAGKFKMSAAKLFRQFQLQKQTVETFEELSPGNEIIAKLLNRIQNNLEIIENKFSEEAFFQCEKLLKTNYQLIRTLRRMMGNQKEDISQNLSQKIIQLEKQLNEIREKQNLTSYDMESYYLAQHFLQKAKTQNENNHPLVSAIYLRTVYKLIDIISNPDVNDASLQTKSKNELETELQKVLYKVETLPDNNEKELLIELTKSIKNNLNKESKNNLKAAETLLNIAKESLEKNK
ncbi:MAG: hypothetical protein KAR38_09330 [Calditrichia bacterium]|nr:hypothetical protein [Calditrichia bacterium]